MYASYTTLLFIVDHDISFRMSLVLGRRCLPGSVATRIACCAIFNNHFMLQISYASSQGILFENWIRFDEVTAIALVFPFKKNR